MPRNPGPFLVIGVLTIVPLVVSVSAQPRTISAADIQQLQDGVLDASTEISRLRVRDAARAAQLERELDEIREDVIYLRVLLRREGRCRRRTTTRRRTGSTRCGRAIGVPWAG